MTEHDLVFIGTKSICLWKCQRCFVEWRAMGMGIYNREEMLGYFRIINHPDRDCDKMMMRKALE